MSMFIDAERSRTTVEDESPTSCDWSLQDYFLKCMRCNCIADLLLSHLGLKHYIPCASKEHLKTSISGLKDPVVLLTVHRDDIFEFNIRTGFVNALAPLEVMRPGGVRAEKSWSFAGAAFCKGSLYFFGGSLPHNDVKMSAVAKFNVQQGAWTWGQSNMPTWRKQMATAIAIDSDIYVIGGWNGDMDLLDIVERYNTLHDDWSPVPSLNIPRHDCSAATDGKAIYVLGGNLAADIEKLDLHQAVRWEILSTKMPLYSAIGGATVAVGRQIYVFGGFSPDEAELGKSVARLDVDTLQWVSLPLMHTSSGAPKAIEFGGAIYVMGEGATKKYDLHDNSCKTLSKYAQFKDSFFYSASLMTKPRDPTAKPKASASSERQQGRKIKPLPRVIQYIAHSQEAAGMPAAEAAAVVHEQWAQQVELNVGARSFGSTGEELVLCQRIMLLDFKRHPSEFVTRLCEGPELHSCRERMQDQNLSCQLEGKAFIFVEPFQYDFAVSAAIEYTQSNLRAHHVITSEHFEPKVMQAVRTLPSRSNVRLRGEPTCLLGPAELKAEKTFLTVPQRVLRSAASVTQSTTEVHGAQNPRR